jgi:hypothetical protein
MTSSLECIAKIAPDINAAIEDADKNFFISIAAGEVERTLFGNSDTYNLAVAYYACHLMTLSQRDGNSRGVLTMEKEGDLQRSYGGNSSSSEINTTQYLDSYNRLLESRVPTFYMQSGNNQSS